MKSRKRVIENYDEALDVLARCTTVRIGMFDGTRPYVVPVSFGMEVKEGLPVVYFHCGKRGMKVSVLAGHPEVYVEADLFYSYELLEQGIDTRYESVVGFGRCSLAEGEERIRGLEFLCEHCGYAGHPVDVCLGLPITNVCKVALESITGKRTLPGFWGQAQRMA